MTWVSYPDLEVTSDNGLFRFQARSPDNEGTAGAGFQRHFRYTLERDGRLVWEDTQQDKAASPRALYLSEEGITVVRAQGFGSVDMVVRNPAGETVGQFSLDWGEENDCTETTLTDHQIEVTTAGARFPGGLLPYFFHFQQDYFGLYLAWDRRVLFDINLGKLVPKPEPALTEQAVQAEVKASLKAVRRHLPTQSRDRPPVFEGALSRLVQARPPEALELFQALERQGTEADGYQANQVFQGAYYWGDLGHRARVGLAQRLIGHRPLGYGAIGFFEELDQRVEGLFPDPVPDRDERLANLPEALSPEVLLKQVGAPDRILPQKEKVGSKYIWTENWVYFYGTGADTRELEIAWKSGNRGATRQSREIREMFTPRW